MCAWTCTWFELVTSTKEWNKAKQKPILSTLLSQRGKLVDYFVELNDKTKLDLQAVKQTLIQKVDLVKNPLLVGRLFSTRDQGLSESGRIYGGTFCTSLPDQGTGISHLAAAFYYRVMHAHKSLTFIAWETRIYKECCERCVWDRIRNELWSGRLHVNAVHQKPKNMQPITADKQDIRQDLWQQIDKRMDAIETNWKLWF